MSASEDTREDKVNRIDRILIYLIKLIVLVAVAVVTACFSNNLFSTCISTLTFVATVLMDSIINYKKLKSLNLHAFVNILSVVILLSSVISIILSIFGLIYFHDGSSFESYQIITIAILLYLAVSEITIECIIAIRTKD